MQLKHVNIKMKDFKIISETRNALFKRKEVEATVNSEITPNRVEVKKALATHFKVSEDQLKVKTILGKYGDNVFTINSNVYDSVEDRDYVEPKTAKEKKDDEQAKAAEVVKEEPREAEPVEASKEETPVVEAPKEEVAPKVEEKTEEKPAEVPLESKLVEESK